MITIKNTLPRIGQLYQAGSFQLPLWECYINGIYKDSAHIFEHDIEGYLKSGEYTFEKDFLPILNQVWNNQNLDILEESFIKVTENLNQRVIKQFGRELDIDLVLYLGLGNGAGWVTQINETNTVLLGIEKILELHWYDIDAMYGLIYHELGHVYQKQYGLFEQKSNDNRKNYVWQLFIEGIAMVFEQSLVGDSEYYHQDKQGWKLWCESHLEQILTDFDADLPAMTRMTQRYFGDWADYQGHSDVGYYLGTKFVRALLTTHKFDQIIQFDIDEVYDLYLHYLTSVVHSKR